MQTIQLVVFDWAGTTVDSGSNAPVAAFREAFSRRGVTVANADIRRPMGLHKKDHIRTMLQTPIVAEAWLKQHGRAWTEEDVAALFEAFMPLQLEVIDKHSDLIPGLLETVAYLKSKGIRIGGTTGYFRAAADLVVKAAKKQGYSPDVSLCPEDVSVGRPAPWMVYKIMETVGVYPPTRVVKIGDTVPDIQEGRNAGVWTVGVARTSSEVGLTLAELKAAPADKIAAAVTAATNTFMDAGAHEVIDSVAHVPALIERLNQRIARGERP